MGNNEGSDIHSFPKFFFGRRGASIGEIVAKQCMQFRLRAFTHKYTHIKYCRLNSNPITVVCMLCVLAPLFLLRMCLCMCVFIYYA